MVELSGTLDRLRFLRLDLTGEIDLRSLQGSLMVAGINKALGDGCQIAVSDDAAVIKYDTAWTGPHAIATSANMLTDDSQSINLLREAIAIPQGIAEPMRHEMHDMLERLDEIAASRHPGGVNFAFVDGSVRYLSQYINIDTYVYLSGRRDGRVVPRFD